MNVQNDPFDMNEARTGALDATAEAIQKIKVQYTKSQEYGLDCVKTLEDAVSSAEDTMFYLASASSMTMMTGSQRSWLPTALRISLAVPLRGTDERREVRCRLALS